MISIISGKLGGGKSLFAVWFMAQHLRRGGIVATNITLDIPSVEKFIGRNISPSQVLQLSENDDPAKIPRGDFRGEGSRRVVCVLDEALNWFDNTKSKGGQLNEWEVWLRQSDKLGQNVYFISQVFTKFVKSGRDLAQQRIFATDLARLRLFKLPFPLFRNWIYVSVMDIQTDHKVSSHLIRKSKAIFSCYRTAELFGALEAGDNAYSGVIFFPPSKVLFWGFFLFSFNILVIIALSIFLHLL